VNQTNSAMAERHDAIRRVLRASAVVDKVSLKKCSSIGDQNTYQRMALISNCSRRHDTSHSGKYCEHFSGGVAEDTEVTLVERQDFGDALSLGKMHEASIG
jgi:hypothetical protein